MPKNRPRTTPSSSLLRADLRGPLLLCTALLVASWAFISFAPMFSDWLFGDARYYESWGGFMANHLVPYRDFRVEYPPGALLTFLAPVYLRKIFGYYSTYYFWLRVELLVFALLALLAMAVALSALGASRRRATAALAAAAVAPAVLGPIALFHFDYWAAMFAVAAVAALLVRRPVLACALAAAGGAAKVYPLLLVPFAFFELWRYGRWRSVAAGVGAAAAVLAVAVGPFAIMSPSGVWWAVRLELVRPLEVESVAASFYAVAHLVAGVHLQVVLSSGGSHGFAGSAPKTVSSIFGVGMVVSLVGIYLVYLRGRRTAEDLVAACAAVVAAYIVFSKVFSPQYLVGLFVLVPLVGGRRGLRASALLLLILGVTQIFEPYDYAQYFHMRTAWLIWIVFVRNLLVVVLLGMLALPRASEREAEQLDPVRAAGLG